MRCRLKFGICFLLLAVLMCDYAHAENRKLYAEGVIAWTRGGGTDTTFRALIDYINAHNSDLHINPINKTGFSGAYATRYVYEKKPDGKTILINAENPPLYKMLEYGNHNYDDFECILLAATEPASIVVPASSKWRSLTQMFEAVKNGETVTEASSNIGGMPWTVSSMLNGASGIIFQREWYIDDLSAILSIFDGSNDLTFAKVQLVREPVRNGRLRFISIIGDERIEDLPDIPAIVEEVPAFKDYLPWGPFYGAFLKKGTPPEIIQRWQKAFMEAYESEEFQRFLYTHGMTPLGLSGEEANKYIHDWQERTLKALAKSNLNLNFKFNRLNEE